MRRKLVAGNWKSNGSANSISVLTGGLAAGADCPGVDIAVCVPYVFIPAVVELLKGSPVRVGAQNVSEFGPGAFTGEVHAEMLVGVGCEFVIVGHSERRQLLGEGDQRVANKLARAMEGGLTPILCVGESLQHREAGVAREVILGQLDAVREQLRASHALSSAAIAYEPIWAIGTGMSATPAQAQEVHEWIRCWLTSAVGVAAADCRILYGGSVTPVNATGLFACPDIDGALVGGAALSANDFLEICQCAK